MGGIAFVGHHFNYPVAVVKRSSQEISSESVDYLRRIPKHQNLMHFYFTEIIDDFIFLAYEMFDCTLEEYAKNIRDVQAIISKKEVCSQLLDGLYHLRAHGYNHDLKEKNVVLKIDYSASNVLVKLLDTAITPTNMVRNNQISLNLIINSLIVNIEF